MTNCIFCKIASGEIPSKKVYEDNHAFAFLDTSPGNVGHTLVIPKKHFETIDKMNKKELDKVTEAILKISGGIMKLADGMNIVQNNNKVAGQLVSHVHFHLIPRYKGDGHRIGWDRNENVTEDQSKEFLEKIKTFLK